MNANDDNLAVSDMPAAVQRLTILPHVRQALSIAISATPLLHKELREELAAELEAEFAKIPAEAKEGNEVMAFAHQVLAYLRSEANEAAVEALSIHTDPEAHADV
jgi:hypothetical protein